MLKIGDTFVQDGITYKVIRENEAGLISKVVDKEEVKVDVVATETTPKRRTRKTTESV